MAVDMKKKPEGDKDAAEMDIVDTAVEDDAAAATVSCSPRPDSSCRWWGVVERVQGLQ